MRIINAANAREQAEFGSFRKRTFTDISVERVKGPVAFQTTDGLITIGDDRELYIAVDGNGNPYPIAPDEFDRTYEPADDRTAERLAEKREAGL